MDLQYDNVLIDCSNFSYRYWWPVRDFKTPDGVYNGMEFGFLKNFLSLTRRFHPAEIFLVWDGRPTRCLGIFPRGIEAGKPVGYKANRKPLPEKEREEAWCPRFAALRDCLKSLVNTLYHPDCEADEQIARFVLDPNNAKNLNLIVSNDGDLSQLVTRTTHILKIDKETGSNIIHENNVRKEWGCDPQKIPLFKAIRGDVSDGFGGIKRVLTTVILEILENSNSFEEMISYIQTPRFREKTTYSNFRKLNDGIEIIKRNYSLAELFSQKQYPYTLISEKCGSLDDVVRFCVKLYLYKILELEEWKLLLLPNS